MTIRYQRVAEDLRNWIATGVLTPGQQLPIEPELASQFEVSTPTLRRALEALQTEGLIEKRHGLGNFVRTPLQRLEYASGSQRPGKRTPGDNLHISVSVSEMKVHGPLSSLMEVTAETPVIEYVFLTRKDDMPYALVRVYVPQGIALLQTTTISRASPWGENIREGLAEAGIDVVSTTERMTARPPTTKEAEKLRLSSGISVLAIERKSTDVNGRVVEGSILVLPGDRAQALYTTATPHRTEL